MHGTKIKIKKISTTVLYAGGTVSFGVSLYFSFHQQQWHSITFGC
jgi:hypothetical protein